MNRRTFVTLGAGALLLGPLATQAQRTWKTRTIGWLSADPQVSPEIQAYFTAVMRGLGWIEGTDFVYSNRFGDSRPERLSAMIVELVQMNCDLIIALGTEAPLALKQATTVIPIVIVSAGDPVANGLVPNLARPGGNITGLSWVSHEIAAKRLQILKELLPGLSRAAFLWDPNNSNNALLLQETETAGRMLAIQIQSVEVRKQADFADAFQVLARQRVDALIVADAILTLSRLREIVEFASTNKLPTMNPFREFTDAGGLISYGPNLKDMITRTAGYVDKILRGTNPADMPIEQPTQFDMVINLKTAKALGITAPQSVLLRAQVIE
jgi:putative tryptophan/tyrosine transport system substrate-binding protein